MFEKTREIVRKDHYGFPDEESPHRVVMMGNSQSRLSRRELSLMAGCEPILAGDIQDNPSFDHSLPPSQDNFLFTVTVTVESLGGTRNLVCDGKTFYLVHGERKYRLNDEGLVRKRAIQLEIKPRELAKVLGATEERIFHAVTALRPHAIDRLPPVLSQ
jgi:hypothetical protein